MRPTDPTGELHRVIDQTLQAEPTRQRGRQQQARIRDEIRVIEGRLDPVDHMRYSRH
jgi:hypothetical protein